MTRSCIAVPRRRAATDRCRLAARLTGAVTLCLLVGACAVGARGAASDDATPGPAIGLATAAPPAGATDRPPAAVPVAPLGPVVPAEPPRSGDPPTAGAGAPASTGPASPDTPPAAAASGETDTSSGPRSRSAPPMHALPATGVATVYHPRFHGRRTSSGARYDHHGLSAAHRTLPMGAHVRVTSLHSGRSVVVTINDRGPWIKDRLIDLSSAAARQLGMHRPGTMRVRIEAATR